MRGPFEQGAAVNAALDVFAVNLNFAPQSLELRILLGAMTKVIKTSGIVRMTASSAAGAPRSDLHVSRFARVFGKYW
jgi:hypothetical protein